MATQADSRTLTGSLIQGGPIWKLQSKNNNKKCVYEEMLPPESKNVQVICWACFTNMGPKN